MCFLCEERANAVDNWYIYDKIKRVFEICVECSEQLPTLYDPEASFNSVRRCKCSICRKKLIITEWRIDTEYGVFLDIFRNNQFYRICKTCFDRDIGII